MSQSIKPTSPAPLPVSEGALASLRLAFAALAQDAVEPAALRAAVCEVARQARAGGVAPERLLVAVKALWRDECLAHQHGDLHAQARLFDQMVTLCIHEYFA